MIISILVAYSKNRVIGRDNSIPWYLPADLRWFKEKTLGHHVIMGRNTYESIGRPLPKRTNIIITRDLFYAVSGCVVAHSLAEALELAAANGETEAFVIGGGQIYRQALPICDRLYLTEVDVELEGMVHFPEVDKRQWEEIFSEPHPADDRHQYPFIFKILERKQKRE
jgi:dihydrofolate reductase